MVFQRWVGQYVPQTTAQQSRPQIRVTVGFSQVVNTDHYHSVQHADLTKEDDFRFRTRTSKQHPTFAVRTSGIFDGVFDGFFDGFFDGVFDGVFDRNPYHHRRNVHSKNCRPRDGRYPLYETNDDLSIQLLNDSG